MCTVFSLLAARLFDERCKRKESVEHSFSRSILVVASVAGTTSTFDPDPESWDWGYLGIRSLFEGRRSKRPVEQTQLIATSRLLLPYFSVLGVFQ